MSWDIFNGYVPRSFNEILATLVDAINSKYGTSYTTTTIQATNMYKYFYGGIQVIMEVEQQISALSGKMQQFITTNNQRILQPRGTVDGFIDYIKTDGVVNAQGSFDPILTEEQRGKISFAVDLDPTSDTFDTQKQTLLDYMKQYLSVGLYYFAPVGDKFLGAWDAEVQYAVDDVVFIANVLYKATSVPSLGDNPIDGSGAWALVTGLPANFHYGVRSAVNGQPFWYAFYTPRYGEITELSITLPISKNKNATIPSQNTIQDLFAENWDEVMVLGANLEPETVLNAQTIGFASRVEYTGIYTDPDGNTHEFDNAGLTIPFDVKINPIDPNAIVVVYA